MHESNCVSGFCCNLYAVYVTSLALCIKEKLIKDVVKLLIIVTILIVTMIMMRMTVVMTILMMMMNLNKQASIDGSID